MRWPPEGIRCTDVRQIIYIEVVQFNSICSLVQDICVLCVPMQSISFIIPLASHRTQDDIIDGQLLQTGKKKFKKMILSSTNLQLPMLTYTTIAHTVCQLVMPFLTHSFFASEDCVLQKMTSTQNPKKWLSSSFDAITLWMWSCKQSPGPKMFPGPLHCYHLRRVWIHLAPGLSWPTIHTICLSNVSFWTNGHLSNRMTKPKWYSLSLHQLPTDGQSTYATVWSDPVSPATDLSLPNHRQVHSLVEDTTANLSLDWQ